MGGVKIVWERDPDEVFAPLEVDLSLSEDEQVEQVVSQLRSRGVAPDRAAIRRQVRELGASG